MSDAVLSLGITVLLLTVLAAWVPLLHTAERLMDRYMRVMKRELPKSCEPVQMPEASFERQTAQ